MKATIHTTNIMSKKPIGKKVKGKKSPYPHDHFVKKILSKKPYCLDIFKLILSKKQMDLFDWTSLKTELSSFIDKEGREKRMDLLVSVCRKDTKQRTKILFLIEHKSQGDPLVLLQFLIYQMGIYQKTKDPIIPVLINQSPHKVWKGPLNFHDYLNNFRGKMREYFRENVLFFKPLVLNMQDEKTEKDAKGLTIELPVYILTNIWQIDEPKLIEAFRLSRFLGKLERRELIGWVVDYVRQYDSSFNWRFIDEIEKKALKKEDRVMETILEEARADARQEGIQQGLQQGIQQGRQQGIQQGLQQGIQQGRQQVILNMLKNKLDISIISEVTGLPEKEIKKLKNGS